MKFIIHFAGKIIEKKKKLIEETVDILKTNTLLEYSKYQSCSH